MCINLGIYHNDDGRDLYILTIVIILSLKYITQYSGH